MWQHKVVMYYLLILVTSYLVQKAAVVHRGVLLPCKVMTGFGTNALRCNDVTKGSNVTTVTSLAFSYIVNYHVLPLIKYPVGVVL